LTGKGNFFNHNLIIALGGLASFLPNDEPHELIKPIYINKELEPQYFSRKYGKNSENEAI